LGARRGAGHLPASVYRGPAPDQACLPCHDGPIHHAEQTFTPSCSSCHVEHRGAYRLASHTDRACTECHADLKTNGAPTRLAANITGFDGSHPEIVALRPGSSDPGTIRF